MMALQLIMEVFFQRISDFAGFVFGPHPAVIRSSSSDRFAPIRGEGALQRVTQSACDTLVFDSPRQCMR